MDFDTNSWNKGHVTGMLPISTCCIHHKPQHRVQGMLGMNPSLYLTKGGSFVGDLGISLLWSAF